MSEQQTSSWRWFPVASLAALGVVVAVNAGMIYAALHTFPGDSSHGGFEASNMYNRIMKTEDAEAALGWKLSASLDGRIPLARVLGRDGQPLAEAIVTATATRPLGPLMTTELSFSRDRPGQWRAEDALPQPGQWDLSFKVVANGETYTVTQRVLAK